MLCADLIELSTSAWVSPIIMMPKKGGSFGLNVDYRNLNPVTHPDPFQMPRIDELINGLAGASLTPHSTTPRGTGRYRNTAETRLPSSPLMGNTASWLCPSA